MKKIMPFKLKIPVILFLLMPALWIEAVAETPDLIPKIKRYYFGKNPSSIPGGRIWASKNCNQAVRMNLEMFRAKYQSDLYYYDHPGTCSLDSEGWPVGQVSIEIHDLRSGTEVTDTGSDLVYTVVSCPEGYALVNGPDCAKLAQLDGSDDLGDNDSCKSEGNSLVGNPVHIGSGNKYQAEIDYEGNGPNALKFIRYYNSQAGLINENTWSHNYNYKMIVTERDENNFPLSIIFIRPNKKILRFDSSLVPDVFFSYNRVWYLNEPDKDGKYQLKGEMPNDGSPFQPPHVDKWILTTPSGQEVYAGNYQIQSIVDYSGRGFSLQTSGATTTITNSLGESISFVTSTEGNVTQLTTPLGNFIYNYSGNNLLDVTYPDGRIKQYLYEDASNINSLTGIIDERGIRYASWEYNSSGMATASYHAGGVDRIDISGYANGGIINSIGTRTITDSRNNQTTYTMINNYGRPTVSQITGCTNCGFSDAQFYYDANANLSSRILDGVREDRSNFDKYGNPANVVVAVGTPEQKQYTYTYDSRFPGKVTSITEPSVYAGGSKVTTYTYDSNANITNITINGYTPGGVPVSRTSTFQYAGPQNQISQYDGPRTDVNDIILFNYYPDDATQGNNRARLSDIRTLNGRLIKKNITYTATGKIDTEEYPNDLKVDYNYYPGNDRLKEIIRSNALTGRSRISRFTYLPTGELATITQAADTPIATTITFTYDDARRLTRITDGLGNYMDYTLDTEGNVLNEKIYDANGTLKKTLNKTYDVYNRLDVFTQLNETQDIDFNPDGTVNLVVDGKGTRTKYDYDSLKRLIQVTQDQLGSNPTTANALTQYSYDVQDNVTSVTDANNGVTSYVYDDLGNLLARNSPDTGLSLYRYDEAGNVTGFTNAKGQVFSYTYDDQNRIILEDAPGANYDISYVYDTCLNGIGKLCEVNNFYSNVKYNYNKFGDIINHQNINYGYDFADRIKIIKYPSGAIVRYVYNLAGEVVRVTLNQNGNIQNLVTNASHAPFGQLETLLYGNGMTLNQTFDTAYRLVSNDALNALSFNYTQYDANGNIVQIQDVLGSGFNDYSYDENNRLVSATGGFGAMSYAYDLVGNRTRLSDSLTTTDYLYEVNSNRLSQLGSDLITLDQNGNTVSDGRFNFRYNASNRLVRITGKNNAEVAKYQYNGLGQRIKKLNGASTSFTYGLKGELLVEKAGYDSREYIYLDNKLLAFIDNKTTSANAPSIVVSTDPVLINNAISIEWNGIASPSVNDWVGVYVPGAADTDFLNWTYTGGSSTGSVNLLLNDASLIPGASYEIRLFSNDGYTLLAKSRKFTVSPPVTTLRNLTVDSIQGGNIKVAWNGIATPTAYDWYGVYVPGSDDTAFLDWAYTNGTASGSKSISLNSSQLVPGQTYELRLFANDGYTQLAVSEPFILLDASSVSVSSQIYYIHNDHLGTPNALTDSAGQLVWKSTTWPFGKASINNDVDQDGVVIDFNIRQPGQYYDWESGLYYNYFRYYDPNTGRYITSDPIGLAGGINTYAYVYGNPVRWSDRLGLLVDGVYDSSTGTITVTDRDTGQSVSIPAVSGGKPFGDPILPGRYEILDQARNPESFRLDPLDRSPRNDTHDPTGRDRFRLHEPGRTIGCIAAEDRDQWEQLRDLINSTKTTTVPDNATPWWKFWAPPETIIKYGDLIVR